MKKILLLLIGCILFCGFMGCSKKISNVSDESGTAEMAQENIVDCTQAFEEVDMSLFNEDELMSVKSELSFAYSCQSVNDIYEKASYIVRGNVVETYFTVLDGMSYTVVNLKIIESFKGELESNSIITILISGGYMTLQQHISYYKDSERFESIKKNKWKSTYIETRLTDAEYPQKNDEYVIALMDNELREGTYVPLNEYETIFKKTGDTYVRTLPSDNYFGNEVDKTQIYLKENRSFDYDWFKKKIKSIQR